ncbi:hypothetical protein Cgig2_004937 [Carnegiea gigantea]|uniref:Uncharacterized protein n=1 Tax=Carnegiea gigantea TaxID=171969 RepID=A0A9Q1L1E0_9CARY|nr:hypothetical protein Cgig2_004937 [Carnegiea gigantea]
MHPLAADPELMPRVFRFNPDLLSNFLNHRNSAEVFEKDGIFQTLHLADPKSSSIAEIGFTNSSDSTQVPDFSDACLKFISDILLEEDLDESPTSLQDYMALLATEKSLYDGLGKEYFPSSTCLAPSLGRSVESPDSGFDRGCSDGCGIEGLANGDAIFMSNWQLNNTRLDPFPIMYDIPRPYLELNYHSSGSSNGIDDLGDGLSTSSVSTLTSTATEAGNKLAGSSRRKNHQRDDYGHEEGRSNKQQASYNEDYVEMEQYDDVLLCRADKGNISTCANESSLNEVREKLQKTGFKGRTSRRKKQSKKAEEVDLRTLLSGCAQAVSNFDIRTANELLKQVRQHSSPYGDSLQRLAHHFANGIEARLAGTGSTVPTNLIDARISSSEFLKAYKLYVSAVPFRRMSYFLANNTILKLAEKATKIHIIDFGILFGLQWPCLIQNLSRRPVGPPNLRITGIDYPQHGFRPAEKVEATGRRLSGYCERFNVPFRYETIAKKWETIRPEDLNIESDELVIVNCMLRSVNLLDDTVAVNSPRDAFLRLIKQINPRLFIHAIVNGTFNTPFFITRFREALFQYSSVFDIFEATMTREDRERLLIENEICGQEVLNAIACEGAERIQRPETYKQWQERTIRAGLRQVPLDEELVNRAKTMVKANYHKDFVVDEDRRWVLQGWKGRTLCALSLPPQATRGPVVVTAYGGFPMFISEIVMEEDLDDQTASLYDYASLQATEKSVDIDYEEERKSKHLASHIEEYVEMEQYDDVLFCKEDGDGNLCCNCINKSLHDGKIGKFKGSKQKKRHGKRKGCEGEAVDLMTLLVQKLPLEYEVVKRVKDHVKQNHHKDFLIEEEARPKHLAE